MTTGKRYMLSKGKGYLSAAGPQARFVAFLLAILIIYTLILRVFQKLAEVVQLPVFLPIALTTLLLFIGVAGTVYSHRFIGPIRRIRRTIDRLADGDVSVSLRVRESDDPVLQDLASSINALCDASCRSAGLSRAALRKALDAADRLRAAIDRSDDPAQLQAHLGTLRAALETLTRTSADPTQEERGPGNG